MIFSPFFYSVIGGLAPALIWLFFWLREDREHPEPKLTLLLAFLAGMLAIPLALMLEWAWQEFLRNSVVLRDERFVLILLVGYAFIEEIVKFALVRSVIFWRMEFDEPVDAMVYLITAALKPVSGQFRSRSSHGESSVCGRNIAPRFVFGGFGLFYRAFFLSQEV